MSITKNSKFFNMVILIRIKILSSLFDIMTKHNLIEYLEVFINFVERLISTGLVNKKI